MARLSKTARKLMAQRAARKRFVFPRRRHRYRPGTVALRELNGFQKKSNLVIRKWPFIGLCLAIASEIGCDRLPFDKAATVALHAACEAFLVDYFKALDLTARHANRVTIKLEDVAFVKRLMNICRAKPIEKSTRN